MEKSLIIKIKKELQNIKVRYQTHYGAVIFDIYIKKREDGVELEGIVLTERQKKEVLITVREIFKSERIINKIRVLAEPKERLQIGWAIAKGSIVDIWSNFPGMKKNNDKKHAVRDKCNLAIYGERGRATQLVRGDAVRLLASEGRYCLVQSNDLTVGWVEKLDLSICNDQAAAKKWFSAKKVCSGEMYDIILTMKKRNKFISFAKKYLYVPYVWGGTTELGIDCSGLVQKFFLEIFGILLPRHSADQAACGEQVSLEKRQFGDLIFLREKRKKYAHIGIVIEKMLSPVKTGKSMKSMDNILILNARREKNGVVIESAEEILKNYKLISINRLIKIK